MGQNCGCGRESNETIIDPADLRIARRNKANLARITNQEGGEPEPEKYEGDTMVFRKEITR